MKRAGWIAVALIVLAAAPARAFEAELVQEFPAPGASQQKLSIIGSTDLELMAPLIVAFQARQASLEISYTQASSKELYGAVAEGSPQFDLAISSAMDLQTKLANDGLALPHRSAETAKLPDWARWRDRVIAFTEEAAVIVYRTNIFLNGPPLTRADLAHELRSDPELYRGRVATYDPEISGAGYLFATQDARRSETFWSLAELFGAVDAELVCCSAEMIDGVASGRFLIAYNAVSPYAIRRLREGANITVVTPEDYTHVMLRTALIPISSRNVEDAGEFIDFLLSTQGRNLLETEAGLPPLNPNRPAGSDRLQPIALGPGLLVYLDRLKRERFLAAWNAAVVER